MKNRNKMIDYTVQYERAVGSNGSFFVSEVFKTLKDCRKLIKKLTPETCKGYQLLRVERQSIVIESKKFNRGKD